MSATERFLRRALGPGRLCPTPFKQTFPTMAAGSAMAEVVDPDDPTLDAYRCVCGGIHIGHHRMHNRRRGAA